MKRVAAVLVMVCLALQGNLPAQDSIFGAGVSRPQVAEPRAGEAGADGPGAQSGDPVEAALAALDLRGKICQLLMVTPEGLHAPSTDDMAFLQAYTPGAVIVRRSAQPVDARRYALKVRAAEQVNGIPMLVGANLYRLAERDRGMASGFVQLPSLLSISAARDTGAAEDLGELIAEHMRMMGFNFYVGPPLELAPRIDAAEGSIRNFGSDPGFAASAGMEISAVLKARGVLPMPIGFPGGGANHGPDAPAVLTTPREQLPTTDLLPYIRAIEAGAELMHVGSVLTPTISAPPGPASLSQRVMVDLLRVELGYKGVIVAGPMDTPDLVARGEPKDAALAALNAGADMILWDRADTLVMGAVAHIEAAVAAGLLSEAVVNAAVTRVLRLKFQHAQRLAGMEAPKKNLTSQKKMEESVREMERRAITVIQNRGQVLPLREQNAMPVLVTGVVGSRELRDGIEKHMKPISQRALSTARSLGRIERFEVERITKYVRGIRTAVVIFTEGMEADGAIALIRGLRNEGIRVVAVLLGYPSLAPRITEADAIVLAYCDSATYAQTLKELADALVGEGALGILPAVADLEARVGETRRFDVMEVVRTPPGQLPVSLGEVYPAGLAVRFTPEHAIRSVRWDFGDGDKSKSQQVTHAYDAPGRYPLTLTVEDQSKIETQRTFHVLVRE